MYYCNLKSSSSRLLGFVPDYTQTFIHSNSISTSANIVKILSVEYISETHAMFRVEVQSALEVVQSFAVVRAFQHDDT